jgi:BioD-like phosphotransacetylase family protein
MKHAFFLAPCGIGVGLKTVSLGLVNALDSHGVRVAFFKPISQRTDGRFGPRSFDALHPLNDHLATDPPQLADSPERLL